MTNPAPSAKPYFRAISGTKTSLPSLPFDDLPVHRAPEDNKGQRREHDIYQTGDPRPILSLLAYDGTRLSQSGCVWEPACGYGHLVLPMRAYGLGVCASDLIDRGCPDSWVADYFTCLRSRAPAIVTNPPYNLINARDGKGRWLRHTLDMPGWDYLALLLNADWEFAVTNGLGQILDDQPYSYRYAMRFKVDFTGEGSPPQRNCWFVWDRTISTKLETRFMDSRDPFQEKMNLEAAE